MIYQQPDFFRFGSDSLWLTEEIRLRSLSSEILNILELGAGSGVISCELASFFPQAQFACVEVQPEFIPYLQANLKQYLPKRSTVELMSVRDFNPTGERKFDLIVFNPPYFETASSRSSPNQNREICRKHVIDAWEHWTGCVKRSLSATGEAFWVHRQEREMPTGLNAEKIASKGELGIWRAGLDVE